jgi:hypothetical protein
MFFVVVMSNYLINEEVKNLLWSGDEVGINKTVFTSMMRVMQFYLLKIAKEQLKRRYGSKVYNRTKNDQAKVSYFYFIIFGGNY